MYLCPMRTFALFLIAVACLLPGCTSAPADAASTPSPTDLDADTTAVEKFIPYQERLAQQEKAERARLGVREVRTLQPSPNESATWSPITIARYDPRGNLISEETRTAQGELRKSVENTWQGDLLLRSVVKSPQGRSYRAVYEYDARKNKRSETLFKPSGDTLLTRRYRYDPTGNETEAWFTDQQRNRRFRKTTAYNALGQPTTVTEYLGDSITWREHYTIQPRKWRVTRQRYNGDTLSHFITEFDKAGRAIRIEQLGPDDDLQFGINYLYDAEGRLFKESQYGKEGKELQSVQYTFDEAGLKTEQITLLPGLPQGAVTRYEYVRKK